MCRIQFASFLSLAVVAIAPSLGRSQPQSGPLSTASMPELSRVPGVGIKRWPFESLAVNKHGVMTQYPSSFLFFFYKRNFESVGTLSFVLEDATGIRRQLVLGTSALPKGMYEVTVATHDCLDDGKVTRLTKRDEGQLFRAFEQTFNVRISRQKRNIEVLVLCKGRNWGQGGFKPDWGPGVKSYSSNEHFYRWNMGEFAGNIENFIEDNAIVLNETGLDGRFSGTAPSALDVFIRQPLPLAGVQKVCQELGLELQRATRELEVLVIANK